MTDNTPGSVIVTMQQIIRDKEALLYKQQAGMQVLLNEMQNLQGQVERARMLLNRCMLALEDTDLLNQIGKYMEDYHEQVEITGAGTGTGARTGDSGTGVSED